MAVPLAGDDDWPLGERIGYNRALRLVHEALGPVDLGASPEAGAGEHGVGTSAPAPAPYTNCGRCHGTGIAGGWQGRCPQCGGAPS